MAAVQPALVQTIGTLNTGNTTAQTSAVITVPSTVTAGHAIIVALAVKSSATVSISDSRGNTYTQDAAALPSTSDLAVRVFSAPNVTGLQVNDTINFTFGNLGTSQVLVVAVEVSGLPQSAVADVSVVGTQGDTGSALYTALSAGPTGTVTQNNDFLLALFGSLYRAAGVTFSLSTPSGWAALSPSKQVSLGSPINESMALFPFYQVPLPSFGTYSVAATLSPAAYSWGVVLIAYKGVSNQAPNAPYLGSRTGFDATQAATFNWGFTDPDAGDFQGSYELKIINASTGATTYDSGQVSGNVQSVSLSANTLSNNVTYYWAVRTWDNHGLAGPYAVYAAFTTQAAPTAAITAPTASQVISTATTVATAWSVTTVGTQASYRVRILQSGSEVFNSGQLSGTATAYTPAYTLANGTTYQVGVTVWDQLGQQSTEVLQTFSTSYPSAVTPTLAASVVTAGGYIQLTYSSPAPGGGQAATDHVDVYRRNTGATAWNRIATALAASGTYRDYGAVDETGHDYKVTAVTAIGAAGDSATASGTLVIDGVWLHCVSDPTGTARNFVWDSGNRADQTTLAPTFLDFVGRANPVAEIDANAQTGAITVDLEMQLDLKNPRGSTDVNSLRAIFAKRDVVCYRDHRSRKAYIFMPTLNIVDQQMKYSTSLNLPYVDYSEAV